MTMLRFVPTAESQAALERFLESIERLAAAPAEEFEVARQAIRHGFQMNFLGEGSAGGPWDDLAPYTVEQRELLGFPGEHPILVRTGDYEQSFVDPGHPDHVSELDRYDGYVELLEGTAHPYVETHEYGREGDPRVPARPVLLLEPVSEDALGAELDAVFDRLAQF